MTENIFIKMERMKLVIRPVRNILIFVLCASLLLALIKIFPKTASLFPVLKDILIVITGIWLILVLTKSIKRLNFLFKPFKYFVFVCSLIALVLIIFLIFWYNYCFFPNDQDYLQETVNSVKYSGDFLEEIELDLLRDIAKARIDNPLQKEDIDFLLGPDLLQNNIYIDVNPYAKTAHKNNLKYSTGKIFYYTYQKNSLVLKRSSHISYTLRKSKGVSRFFKFDAVLPQFTDNHIQQGTLRIYFTNFNTKQTKKLFEKKIEREKKPDIEPFRYSDVLSSIVFYLQHPGRSVLLDNAEWQNFTIDIPEEPGRLDIEFASDSEDKDYLFLGTPVVYTVKDKIRDNHINIVYLIFDTLAKNHIDLYEYYDEFKQSSFEEATRIIGQRKIITPVIDKYADRICLFDNMFTVGQVTRPSIVGLWTSQTYTKSRMPVFRNLVTKENQKEFYDQNFQTLSDELSKHGYFTKQISCNAQGHGVSNVGVDLGFDENYDYTMEPSELTENFRRIIEFLNDNQNRKFFLYSHINVPHTPMWIPMSYFLKSFPDAYNNFNAAKVLGNIRYLNDSLGKVTEALERLNLMRNTVIIITSDHSRGRSPYFRGHITEKDIQSWMGDSQNVATFYNRSIYVRKGRQHLLNDYMNIPWILIPPQNLRFKPGKISSYVSALDISPTLLDIALNKSCNGFSGTSFKGLLENKTEREKNFADFIPLVGRFQRGFVFNGRYKYWRNLPGLYKYRVSDNKTYLMHQEYLFDLHNDNDEIKNLAHDTINNPLLKKMRKLYTERFIEYPDKNFIQISRTAKSNRDQYIIKVNSLDGSIIYPEVFGEDISYKRIKNNEFIFTSKTGDKNVFMSFETKPRNSKLKISIYKNGKLLPDNRLFSSVESINNLHNPIVLKDKIDFFITRLPGQTGLEDKDIPPGSVFFARIPLNYWLEMSTKQISALPVDYPGGANTHGSTEIVVTHLGEAETRALLHEVPAASGVEINAVLLTALLEAFARWTGKRTLLIEMEGHGREQIVEDVDLSRTIGWFTSNFPLLLDLEEISETGQALWAIQERWRRLPNRGIDYGVLRYLCEDRQVRKELNAFPWPEVNFNYLGQFDQVPRTEWLPMRPALESIGPEQSPEGPRASLLYVLGSVSGGRLDVRWSYSKNLYKPATVERLAENYIEELQGLIAYCLSPESGAGLTN